MRPLNSILLCLCVILGLLNAWALSVKSNSLPKNQAQEEFQQDEHVQIPAPASDPIIFDLDLDASILPPDSMSEIIEAHLPLMPISRAEIYNETAKQSMQEMVDDLGNILTETICAGTITSGFGEIRRWSRSLPYNIRVLRLIEEGRHHPEVVHKLLLAKIETENDLLYSAYVASEEQFKRQEFGYRVRSNDEYYRTNKRYNDSITEWMRLNVSLNAAFYVLVNVGDCDYSAQLADWIRQERLTGCSGLDMHLWLIDQHFKNMPVESYQKRHNEIMAKCRIPESRTNVMAWNSPRDGNDVLMAIGHINKGTLPTISVLQIPGDLKIPKTAKEAVIDNFLEYVDDKSTHLEVVN